jgi:glycosidase
VEGILNNMKKMLFTLMLLGGLLISCDKKSSSVMPSFKTDSLAQDKAFKDSLQKSSLVNDLNYKEVSLTQPSSHKWWHDSVSYQIWPRSFSDADGDGNGDLKGITQKLPYLKELGVGAIWLTPIFKAPSYHNYDTVDHFQIDPSYGSMADFEEFIKQSKTLGIKVILDLVINHVSDQHPWFIKSINKEPGYENYFVWNKNLPSNYGTPWSDVASPESVWHYNPTRQEWYYSVFGYNQPDLNLQNPAVLVEIKKIASFWLAKGVDGFRLDAVRYLIEEGGIPHQADTKSTMIFLEAFNKYIKSQNENALLIGEVYADNKIVANYYDKGDGIDAAFDFHFSMDVINSYREKQSISNDEQKSKYIASVRDAFWRNLTDHAESTTPQFFYAPFVNNHDLDRFIKTVKGDLVAAKIAAELLLTSPGSPYIYYGEEIALTQAGEKDDMYRRGLMQWDSSVAAGFNASGKVWLDESKWFPWKKDFKPWWSPYWADLNNRMRATVAGQHVDNDSIFAVYKKLIALRNSDIVIRSPEKIHLYNDTGCAWVVNLLRDKESRWIIINLDESLATTFTLPANLHGEFKNLFANVTLQLDKEITVEPGQIIILRSEE